MAEQEAEMQRESTDHTEPTDDRSPVEGGHGLDLARVSGRLETRSAEQRIAWALDRFGDGIALASSFGAHSAVCLHMVTRQRPDVPVVLVDTGYLFPETYRFVDTLAERLSLNLVVHRPAVSPAWLEARHGRLWEQGLEGIERYNRMSKVEPMHRALEALGARAWMSGVRRVQSSSRREFGVLAESGPRVKVHPIVDWTDRDVHRYLTEHDLPYHPLWHEGFVSIGDVHTTRPLSDGLDAEDTRFFGLKRECGLHESA